MPTSSKTDWPGGTPARMTSSQTLLKDPEGNAAADGDTLHIRQAIRMISCDTPESHYPTAATPEKAQALLDACRIRLEDGFFNKSLPPELRKYLLDRLTPTAGSEQIEAGGLAHEFLEKDIKARLSGKRLAVLPAGEIIDSYGRMLAYLAPALTAEERKKLALDSPKRKTFNLQLIEQGWAAFFPIFGSLPSRKADFELVTKAARDAWSKKRGAWKKYGRTFLTGYEFRMCIKLADPKGTEAKKLAATAFSRGCIDMSGKKWRDAGRLDFHAVPPGDRLWYWWADRKAALAAFGIKA